MIRNKDEIEIWRDIPGFDGRYQASTLGRIRVCYSGNGRCGLLNPYSKASSYNRSTNQRALRVRLIHPDGRRIEKTVISLVAMTFLAVPPGMVAIHKNGMQSDNSVDNIVFASNRELGLKYGKNANRRPVKKIDVHGNDVDYYPSLNAVAKANHLAYQGVTRRCNGQIKGDEFKLLGYSFRWER